MSHHNRNEDATAGCMVFVIIMGVVLPIATIFDGWVLTKLWAWFVVPAFDLPTIAMTQAMGLSLIASFLTHQGMPPSEKKDTAELFGTVIGSAFGRSLISLAIGWVIHGFI